MKAIYRGPFSTIFVSFIIVILLTATTNRSGSAGPIQDLAPPPQPQASNNTALDVSIHSSKPEIEQLVVTPAEIDEGGRFILSGTICDPDLDKTLSLFIDWGDGHTLTRGLGAAASCFSFSHTCTDDPSGDMQINSYTINLRLSDAYGAFSTSTAVIKVNNIPPTVDAGPDKQANVGQPVSFSASITDPGISDTHTTTWDFGDGSVSITDTMPIHAFALPGEYTVTVTAQDDDGGAGQDTLTVTISEVYIIYLQPLMKP